MSALARGETSAPAERATKLRICGLTKRYRSIDALVGADLDVREGEFLTLLGPSGSGKTTLLRIIAGLIDADDGEVWIDRKSVIALPPHLRDIELVFQNYALFPHLNVFENIAFPLRMRRVGAAEIARRVERSLAAVKLDRLATRMPSELSGGQQQRIALARSMVYEPSIILLDEPLAALDKKLREQLQLELRRMHRELGVTMVYVTHDQQEALLLSDRICLMNEARIEQVGTPADLYFRPATIFAADFIGESNLLDAVVIESGAVTTLRGPNTTVFHALAAPVSPGDKVKIMIRPERLEFASAGQPQPRPNSIAGVIEETTFLGDGTKYYVRVDETTLLTVKTLTRREQDGIQAGARVSLVWDADSAVVLAV